MAKKGITVRLKETSDSFLEYASITLGKSKSLIVEEALLEYLEKNNLLGGYQVNLTSTSVILMRTGNSPEILEVRDRNGVPPEKIADEYRQKLRAPVRLVDQEKDHGIG